LKTVFLLRFNNSADCQCFENQIRRRESIVVSSLSESDARATSKAVRILESNFQRYSESPYAAGESARVMARLTIASCADVAESQTINRIKLDGALVPIEEGSAQPVAHGGRFRCNPAERID
jgi:hypothetical protein